MISSTATPAAQPATLAEALGVVAGLRAEIKDLKAELALLRQKLDAFIRRYFDKKSEAIDAKQLELLLSGISALEAAVAAAVAQTETPPAQSPAAKAARKPARSGIPENLLVERVVLIPEEVKANPDLFREIDQVITKELDYEPGRCLMRHYVRPKFVRKEASSTVNNSTEASAPALAQDAAPAQAAASAPACSPAPVQAPAGEPKEVLIAPLPNRLIEKGMAGVGLLIHLLLSRFEDHLPFFRLEKIFRERHGVPISRQSMVDWTEQLSFWFQPIYEEMKRQMLSGGYLQADETIIRYLDKEEPGRARQGYFWVYARPGGDVLFDWNTSRGHEAPLEFLKDFDGKLQVDGYAAYNTMAQARALSREDKKSGLLLFGCWTHARRKFFDAKDHDRRALWILKQIGLLYAVEKRLRLAQAGPALRQAVRAAESKMILARIGKALERIQPRVLPQSNLGKAIGYTRDRWAQLTLYVEHGEVEIDNNGIENAIRPTAVGKKNFLFIGHPEAGGRSAMIYSIIGSCRRHGIDPAKYLADVLKRLPDMQQKDIASVTPAAWAKAHSEARMLPCKERER